MVKLYAFLGNHGRGYSGNRHNVAWLLLDSMPELAGLDWQRKFKGRYAWIDLPGGRAFFLKPETYMNLSGESVAEAMTFYKISLEELLVVHDEIELPFGTMGFKRGGGLGGHNGLRSIKACSGGADFLRFRLGVGRPDHDDVAGYVLSDFAPEERDALESSVFPKAAEALRYCMDKGYDEAAALWQKTKTI